MKKQFFCLVLALATLFGLCACSSSKELEETKTTDYNLTLSLWLPTSEDTTEEAVKQVQAAINAITKKSINTAIEIHAISEDKYDETVKTRILDIEAALKRSAEEEASRKKAEKEAKKKGQIIATTAVETDNTPVDLGTDSEGNVIQYYPSVSSNQLDIFCIRGYDNFVYYADEGYLSALDEPLASSAKLLKSYVYPTFINAGKYYDTTFAIPNNHTIGEYTYLAVNKRLCTQLSYDPIEFTSVLDCENFINDVAAVGGVTPFVTEESMPGMKYWSTENDGSFSVLGTIVSNQTDQKTRLNIRNVFGLKQYTNTISMIKRMQEAGYVVEDVNAAGEFGVGVIECTAAEAVKYENDYHLVPIAYPRAETDDIYRSMFAVSAYSADVSRSMQVISLINTNSEIRTLLQYGVEGVHWSFADDEKTTIKVISDDYKMNLADTGNEFITYPAENVPMSYWDYGRKQNLESKVSPFLAFDNYIDEDNKAMFDALDKYSAEVYARISAMSAQEFEDALPALKKEVGEAPAYLDITDPDNPFTLVAKYQAWFAENFES